MPEPQPFIVGREAEVDHFAALVKGHTDHWLLNVYGPGGIGKTIVCNKLATYAVQLDIPCARVDGFQTHPTSALVLDEVRASLSDRQIFAEVFGQFERQMQEYQIVQHVLVSGGGVREMFDLFGNVKDSSAFEQLLTSAGQPITEQVRHTISNRFTLERYLRGVEKSLTASLCNSLATAMEQSAQPLALLIDTYEEMEKLDSWICRTFIPALPAGIKIVTFGRNALPKVNFDWSDFGNGLHSMELPELPENDAKQYLRHHGLHNTAALHQIYQFTGGYPLLLVLVVHLMREAGGWNKIGEFEAAGDRDRVATQLLERILREERAREVRAFLEKGCIAGWFNAETISVILEISLDEARGIYDKLQRHSFVERHPQGLKFHDKIRELLRERLKFTSIAEYERLQKRLTAHYAQKAGFDYSAPYTIALPNAPVEMQPSATDDEEQAPILIIPSHPFGDLLRQYLSRKQGLSQKRLAEGIDKDSSVISVMVKGERLTGKQARPRVIDIIIWLYRQGVLTTRPEANALLAAAKMAALQPDSENNDEQWLYRVLTDPIVP